eukprot:2419659-Amphidinium_carterae.1
MRGSGSDPSFIYVVYGFAGARWNRSLLTQFHSMLNGITEDLAARGQVAGMVIGDLNVEVDDSPLLRQVLQTSLWYDGCARTRSLPPLLSAQCAVAHA